MIAAAGAGKTTALQPLVSAWREEGRDVHGVALAWRQADDLTDAGIDQRNVKAFSIFSSAAKAGEIALGPSSVVVVDELSLAWHPARPRPAAPSSQPRLPPGHAGRRQAVPEP
jgi:ATP-dependent exoDNAse (exonuclease V) alpha subunit